MKFKRKDQYAEFVGIDLFLAEIIKQIPAAADPNENAAARARLFSAPTEENGELARDWQEFVVPDLSMHFDSATAQVEHDLEEYFCEVAGNEDFPYCLRIPLEHLDAWLSALNQARLVLAARFAFTDDELSERFQHPLVTLRDLALYQVTIYGWMQELLLTAIRL